MLTESEARDRARARMRSQPVPLPLGDELVLVEDDTLEREWGWVFFFASRLWLETGDPVLEHHGAGPLIVNRYAGTVHATGTDHPSEYYVTRYETEFARDREGWLLVLIDVDPMSTETLQALRQVLQLAPDEVRDLKSRLPAVVMQGPRAEVVRRCQELLTAGVEAEVRRG